MTWVALKWWQTMKVTWANTLAYRLNFFLQIIGPTIVFYFIKYSLWTSIYDSHPENIINGYTLAEMLSYQTWALIITLLAKGYNGADLSDDIRLGRISCFLIYPFNFWQYHTAHFLALEIVQCFTAAVSLVILLLLGLMPSIVAAPFVMGIIFCLFVSFFYFLVFYAIGLLSFWLDETWVFRVVFAICASFLSGEIVPLEFYPEVIQKLLFYTPFPYITYIPIKIFMGSAVDLWSSFLILGFWSLVVMGVVHWIWKRGMKLYSAAGM